MARGIKGGGKAADEEEKKKRREAAISFLVENHRVHYPGRLFRSDFSRARVNGRYVRVRLTINSAAVHERRRPPVPRGIRRRRDGKYTAAIRLKIGKAPSRFTKGGEERQ